MSCLVKPYPGKSPIPASKTSIEARKQGVDVLLLRRLIGKLRAVQQAAVFPRLRDGRRDPARLALLLELLAEGVQKRIDLGFDMLERLDDLGDALPGDVLKITGFVDAGHGVGDQNGRAQV